MRSTNLSRIDAAHRSSLIKDVHYDLVLDITVADDVFDSRTTVTFTADKDGDTFIDLRAREIRSVTLDGADITEAAVPTNEAGAYDEADGIALTGLSAGKHELVVDAVCVFSRTGQGLHRYVDPADDKVYFYTQFETADAKRVFACFDQPDIKATYTLDVRCDASWKVIGNAEQQVTQDGDAAHHRSSIDYPLSTYLVALCIGDYFEVTDTWTGSLTHHPETPADQPHELTIPLGLYCRQSIAEHLDSERLLTETKQGFDFYHANFGYAYPFGKYDQIFVPEFNMGAMENAGCVTHRDEYVFTSRPTRAILERRCDTVLHEMAHMWFGDLVTMQWWDDLWLNESFATWAATISQAEATEYDTAWVTFANKNKAWAYAQDMLPSTHPISADAGDIETVEQNFDGITYAKGASVLKQLQAYVGREEFFAGVRQHFANHPFGNATFADLLAALEKASGRDLSQWAAQWLQTTGINKLAPRYEIDDNNRLASLKVTQSGAEPGKGELRDHRVAVGLYATDDNGALVRYARADVDVTGEETDVPALVGEQAPELILVNDDDLTYCLMQLDERSTETVVNKLSDFVDPMPRALCWSALWEQVRDAKLPGSRYCDVVATHIAAETESSVIERIMVNVASVLDATSDKGWRDNGGADRVIAAFVDAAKNAEPGSDAQLVFVKGLVAMQASAVFSPGLPVTAASEELVRALAAGNSPLEGIKVDNELRWYALTSLISAGLVDNPEQAIADLKQEDKSSAGVNLALESQSAIPTVEAQRAVFDEVTALDCTLSNLHRRHKIAGLRHTKAIDTSEEFTRDYFGRARDLWRHQPPEMALATLEGLYPISDFSDTARQLVDELLADESLPGGLRRVMIEGRDSVARRRRLLAADEKAHQS